MTSIGGTILFLIILCAVVGSIWYTCRPGNFPNDDGERM